MMKSCLGDPAAAYVPGRNLIGDVGSEGALSLAQGLMNNCLQHHDKCPQPPAPSPILPTRVIDCSDPSKPYLFVSGGVRDRFVSLSYVWGEDQPQKTTKANVDSYFQSIDSTLQSQTIRDAITTTHNLGLRYLWIDTLCIIQDSQADKDRELERMRSYYADSYVTIIAASASRASEGFLQTRRDNLDPASVTIPFVLPTDGSIGTISLASWLATTPSYEPTREPVHKRGWCMQEYFLSPRQLIFAWHTLQYRCQTETRNIGGADNPHWVSSARQPVPKRDLPRSPKTREEKEKIRKAWNAIIENYTKRALSVASDKLVAFAALAEEFQGTIQSPYLAGLWESELLPGLLWKKNFPHHSPKRPKDYQAPSWSWASVDGEVDPGNAYILTGKQEYVADVVRAQTTAKNAKLPFGEVTTGTLVLSAKVEFECVMAPHWAVYRLREPNGMGGDNEPIHEKTGRRMEKIGLGQLDSSDEDIQSGHRSVSIVLIYHRDGLDPDTSAVQGIVVEPVISGDMASDGKKYRRIGFFEREGNMKEVDKWFNGLSKVEIEIV